MPLPQRFYGNPADLVEADDINKKRCRVCVNAVFILGQPVCENNLKFPRCKRDKKRGFKLKVGA